MITEPWVAIVVAAVCVLVSAFCSGTEVALFSLRRVDREQLARSDRFADRRILALLDRPRRLIATVLIGNEAFNSILVVVALGTVMTMFAGESLWTIGVISLAVTLPLVVLIAGVTAKTLAAKAPLAWARMCALPLTVFSFVVTPIRVIVQAIAGIVLAPLGEAARSRPPRDLSEEEFRSLLDAGSAQGQVDARERRMIHRVFEFSDKNVGQVMTPRDRMFALSYDLPMQRLIKETALRGFSRVPIYQKSIDNVRGVLNAKDLVRAAAGKLGRPLNDLLHDPLFVPRTTPVKRLFLTFKQKKVHMAIVVSEYGKVLGLVTMDDLLSQIFGVLRDERAALQSSPLMRPRARTPAVPITGGSGFGDRTTPPAGIETNDSIPVVKVEPVEMVTEQAAPAPEGPPGSAIEDDDEDLTPPAVDLGEAIKPGEGAKRSS